MFSILGYRIQKLALSTPPISTRCTSPSCHVLGISYRDPRSTAHDPKITQWKPSWHYEKMAPLGVIALGCACLQHPGTISRRCDVIQHRTHRGYCTGGCAHISYDRTAWFHSIIALLLGLSHRGGTKIEQRNDLRNDFTSMPSHALLRYPLRSGCDVRP